MNFIINLNDLNIVDQLVKKDKMVEAVIVGEESFAMDIARNTTLEEIKELKDKLKVYVRVNLMFDEIELNELENYLIKLNELKVDLVLFQDFAVKQIVDTLNLDLKLSYDNAILNTNSKVLNDLFQDNISCATLSNEISLEEIKMIDNNTKIPLLMQIHGFCLMSYSKRKLISNYKNVVDLESEIKNEFVEPNFIYEKTSKHNCPIIETNKATLIYSGNVLDVIDFLDELKKTKIKSFIINPIFNSGNYTMLVLNSYIEAVRFLESDFLRYELSKQTYKNQFEMYSKYPLNHGFLSKETIYTIEDYRKHEKGVEK